MDRVYSLITSSNLDIAWMLFEILFLATVIFLSFKFRISGQRLAIAGFVVLAFVMCSSVFVLDLIAQKLSSVVFIFLLVSFCIEFIKVLKKGK